MSKENYYSRMFYQLLTLNGDACGSQRAHVGRVEGLEAACGDLDGAVAAVQPVVEEHRHLKKNWDESDVGEIRKMNARWGNEGEMRLPGDMYMIRFPWCGRMLKNTATWKRDMRMMRERLGI